MRVFRISTAARVAIVAGLVATLLAEGFAFWIRHEVYSSRYDVLQERARAAGELIISNIWIVSAAPDKPPLLSFPRTEELYEVVDSYGRRLDVSTEVRAFQKGRPLQAVPGMSRGSRVRVAP
ncbi:hypothetical protein E1263_15945 [Kribbella antibiotica]|uniref:Uncharacterized protein n=1 Tax=Kribbella antibiotica TaxID=190195 RepID=A0A4R4ZKL4_9ACTN|nr:hypothetical protein [Kribbella antibiotica]TDD59263.1 hypothetical protein E1263_15945 [Kribbella antibiotica]